MSTGVGIPKTTMRTIIIGIMRVVIIIIIIIIIIITIIVSISISISIPINPQSFIIFVSLVSIVHKCLHGSYVTCQLEDIQRPVWLQNREA